MKNGQQLVLNLLDRAITDAVTTDLEVIITLSIFGQKSGEPLHVSELVNPEGIKSLSVHVACKIGSNYPIDGRTLHVMWSRQGLQEVVGFRGSLFPTLSMCQCANFKSNLDGKPLTLALPIWDVCYCGVESGGNLNFLQIYTDSPSPPPHTHTWRNFVNIQSVE